MNRRVLAHVARVLNVDIIELAIDVQVADNRVGPFQPKHKYLGHRITTVLVAQEVPVVVAQVTISRDGDNESED